MTPIERYNDARDRGRHAHDLSPEGEAAERTAHIFDTVDNGRGFQVERVATVWLAVIRIHDEDSILSILARDEATLRAKLAETVAELSLRQDDYAIVEFGARDL